MSFNHYIVTGAAGQLGKEFSNHCITNMHPNFYTICNTRINKIEGLLNKNYYFSSNPQNIIVINCASYNKLELTDPFNDIYYEDPYSVRDTLILENNRADCMKTNAIDVKNLALLCNKYKAKLLHFSTDYVLPENNKQNINEFQEISPSYKDNQITYYGYSKLVGERFIEKFCNDYLIVRTTSLYGDGDRNFISKILNKYKNNLNINKSDKELIILSSQSFCSPTYTKDIVNQSMMLLENNKVGIYHACNQGLISWYDYALQVFNFLDLSTESIKLDNCYTYLRPKYATLNNNMLKLENLNVMRNIDKALTDYLDTYKNKLIEGLYE